MPLVAGRLVEFSDELGGQNPDELSFDIQTGITENILLITLMVKWRTIEWNWLKMSLRSLTPLDIQAEPNLERLTQNIPFVTITTTSYKKWTRIKTTCLFACKNGWFMKIWRCAMCTEFQCLAVPWTIVWREPIQSNKYTSGKIVT